MMKDKGRARHWPRGGWRAAVAAAALLTAGAAHADGDAAAGKRVFARCQSCHQMGPNAKNLVGPELNGVLGRTSGTVAGYSYSPALKSGAIVWQADTIAAYIKNPQAVAKGTKMTNPPPVKDADFANLIAYLATFAPDGSPAQ